MVILPLDLTELCVRKQGKQVLGPITYRLPVGGLTAVIGPNGAGKTTLLRAMHGMEKIASGRISWALPEPQTRAHQAFVFQRPIAMRRTLRDNIAYPLVLAGMPRAEARARADEAARAVGLGARLDVAATDLSGGESQKMALTRALIRQPKILFLDEPCASLDGAATRDIEAMIIRARAAGTTIVMSTHSMGQARRLADEVLFLHHGRLHEHGPAEAFFAHPHSPEAGAFLEGDLLP